MWIVVSGGSECMYELTEWRENFRGELNKMIQ